PSNAIATRRPPSPPTGGPLMNVNPDKQVGEAGEPILLADRDPARLSAGIPPETGAAPGLLQDLLPEINALAQRVGGFRRLAEIPAVYLNDNFGRWRSDFRAQVKHCLEDGVRGRPIAELLQPQADDYFVLKPKHSGFYSTALDILLDYLQVKTVILTGMATNI